MKNILSSVLLCAVMSAACIPAVAQETATSSGSEQEVRQALEKYRTALIQRDADALQKIWTDDYIFVNGAGEMLTKQQRLENLKSGATALGAIDVDPQMKVRVDGDTAVVLGLVTIKGKYSGKETNNKFRSMLVWTKEGGAWRLVANQLTPVAADLKKGRD
jgi:uncharacterized protein (TIGR02246 family)